MKKSHFNSLEKFFGIAALCLAGTLCANASLINKTTANLADLDTTYGTPTASTALVEKGSGLTPDPASEEAWLATQSMVTSPLTFLIGGTSTTPDLTGYGGDYLVVHWGNGDAGSKFFNPNPQGGFFAVFYIEPGTGSVTIAQPSFTGTYANGNSGKTKTDTLDIGGLSGWNIFGATTRTTSVPEPSTIIAGALLLLPLGVGTMRILRKNKMQSLTR